MNRPRAQDNVILCGTYRSGTTWLMEVLSAGPGMQFDFEPLEPAANRAAQALKLRNRYLSPDRTYPALDPVLRRVLRGGIVHPYIKGMSMHPLALRRWKFWASRHVIKLVQGHLLLGYLHERFRARNIVLLVRNPFSVIASLKRQAWWRSDLEEFLDERSADLFQDYPELRGPVLGSQELLVREAPYGISRKIGETAVRYCLENYVPMRQHRARGYRVVRYEELRQDPEGKLSALCQALGIRFTERHRRRLRRPSRTSSPASVGSGPPGGGGPGLTPEEEGLVSRILVLFGFEGLFDGDLLDPGPARAGTGAP